MQPLDARVAIPMFGEQPIILSKTVHLFRGRVIHAILFRFAISSVGAKAQFVHIPLFAGEQRESAEKGIAVAARQCDSSRGAALPLWRNRDRVGGVRSR